MSKRKNKSKSVNVADVADVVVDMVADVADGDGEAIVEAGEAIVEAGEAIVEGDEATTETSDEPKVEAKVAKPRKALADQGRGKPEAKKVINPQPTLDLKKKHIQALKGTMEYKNRQWEIEIPELGVEDNLTSKEMARLTLGQLFDRLGVELQQG
jgi:hypothetical protein